MFKISKYSKNFKNFKMSTAKKKKKTNFKSLVNKGVMKWEGYLRKIPVDIRKTKNFPSRMAREI